MRTLVFLGLCFVFGAVRAEAQMQNPFSVSLATTYQARTAGSDIHFTARGIGVTPNTTLTVFLGSNAGKSSITVGNQTLLVPAANPLIAYQAPMPKGKIEESFTLPLIPSLNGTQTRLFAVLQNGGQVAISNLVYGGPIIEDSLQ